MSARTRARAAVRFPRAIETEYGARLVHRIDVAHQILGERLAWLDQRGDVDTTAADAARVRVTVGAVHSAYQVSLPVTSSSLLPTAQAVDSWATRGAVRAVSTVVAVDIEADQRIGPRTRDEMRQLHLSWARANVDLIKTMDSDTFDDVAKHVVDSVVNGKTDLAKVLEDRFGVSRSRARLIARDQVAKLNSQVTQARHEQLGVQAYEWSSSGDERVRPLHRTLDGTIRRWDDPHPTEGHPGRPIACRCVAIPVVDPALVPATPASPAPPLVPAPPPPPPPSSSAAGGLSPGGLPGFGGGRLFPRSLPPPRAAPPSPGTFDPEAHVPTFQPPLIGSRPLAPVPVAETFEVSPELAALATPAPPPIPRDQVIMGELVAPATGSNPVGVYVGADGVKRYVKLYSDQAQAASEHLANQIYSDLGLVAPKSEVFEHRGRWAYASEIMEDTRSLAGINEAQAKKVFDGFAADVLVANWDVIGLDLDNVLITAKGGSRAKIIRIDNGGSLLMRAKAGRKPVAELERLSEWEGFFSRNTYSRVAGRAGYTKAEDIPTIKKQIAKIVRLRKDSGGWAAYVERVAPQLSEADRAQVVSMLEHRTSLLVEKSKRIGAAAPAAAPSARLRKIEELLGRSYRELTGDAQIRSFGERLRAARKVLTPEEHTAAKTYTGGTYREINRALRTGGVHRLAPAIDRAVGKGLVPEDVVMWRGTASHPQLNALKEGGAIAVGDTLTDLGYASTSASKGVANNFAGSGGFMIRVLVPSGQRGLWVQDFSNFASEQELMLKRGSKLVVARPPKKVGSQWYVDVIYMSDEDL